MRILLVKMSSLGDVVHMLPALTEAASHIPTLKIDWVVEEAFSAVPAWHPSVNRVIPVAFRTWRNAFCAKQTWRKFPDFMRSLRQSSYDLVLDAQGLLKSGVVAMLGRGKRAGHDFATAREGIASLFYKYRYHASWNQHAILRNRSLTAQALGYSMGEEDLFSYGVTPPAAGILNLPRPYVLALHGTARLEKEYSEADWWELIGHINAMSFAVLLPWGNERERSRAERLAAGREAQVLPRLSLAELAAVLSQATGVVGVDTGLLHLTAAFRRPGIGLYPTTPPARFGAKSEPGAPRIENLATAADLVAAEAARRLRNLLL
ncbi:MAG: lipopolysaccharide heptosyltransferase I [Planctomycetes bacterium]|nr:lipopolysaccharide heptosyltransferase I [Planctomycetota bacterium]